MSQVIKRALVTEKASAQTQDGTYVFKVSREADKLTIKAHIERYFKVKVASVNTVIGRTKSKKTRLGNRPVRYYKKAFVRLKENEKISVFEGS